MADKKLEEVRSRFIEKVNKSIICAVLDNLLDEKVLNDEEVENVKKKSSVTHEQARILIDGVRKKGHEASLVLIKSIHARDGFLAKDLSLTAYLEGSPSQAVQAVGPRAILSMEETRPVESRHGIKLCPPKVFDRIQKDESTKIYPILRDSKIRTRLALIICNIEFESCFSRRDGAEKDIEGMEHLLTGLGYQVESHKNLCSEEMAGHLKAFAARKEHKTSDSAFVVLMSHGLRAGLCGVKSQGENSDILSHDTIYSILNNKNCPALRDKPKVIIIQACRGENKGIIYVSSAGTPSADSLTPIAPRLLEDYESDALQRLHVESDLICFCSTTPDNVSWRSPSTGSIFIVQLIKQMQEHAWCYHLEEVFREVQQTFTNNPLQMPTKERATLLKRFYLFPGH